MLSFQDFKTLTNYSELTSANFVGYRNNEEIKLDFIDLGIGLYNFIKQLEEQCSVVTHDYKVEYFDTKQINAIYLETGITKFTYIIENQFLSLLPISAGRVNIEYTNGLSANREFLNLGNHLFIQSLSTNDMFTIYYNATGSDMFMTSPGEEDLGGKRPKFGGVNDDDSDEDPRIRLKRPLPKPKKKSVTPIISDITWEPSSFDYNYDPDDEGYYEACMNFTITIPQPDPDTESKDDPFINVDIKNIFPDDVEITEKRENGNIIKTQDPGSKFRTSKGFGSTIYLMVCTKMKNTDFGKELEINVKSDSWGESDPSVVTKPTNFVSFDSGQGADFE